ncbi:MAG: threonine ammonia-lyase [Solirubrobacteraceae bacterium]
MAEGDPTLDDIRRARAEGAGVVVHTPVLSSRTISGVTGGTVLLKAENLQRTGSFKLRGALAKIGSLGERHVKGVVAGSAGNHAQAVAYAARTRDLPCEVFMPADASIAKTDSATQLGATVRVVEGSVDDSVAAAREHAAQRGLAFIHPFDDPVVIAGQATLGLELLADVPDLAKVVVPVGGGGLASGIAIAVKRRNPRIEVVGIQVEAWPAVRDSLRRGRPVETRPAATIADGIAVKRPGELTLGLIERWLDGVEVVAEDEVAEAMVLLLERAKLVVEGAGAVGVAALMGEVVEPAAQGVTVVVLSGGNVDPGVLAGVVRRHESSAGRRLVVLTRVADRPGGLAALLSCVAAAGANLVDVSHVREGLDLHVRETAVELVMETRGPEHADQVLAALREREYEARVLR